ncbi:uncharacterized protein [Primulina huaijiensis]|uniref:uncharacterized protein n=1 Tax=Primulina huaijiensis TaxID=1492673 RepID=UPI003CC713CD
MARVLKQRSPFCLFTPVCSSSLRKTIFGPLKHRPALCLKEKARNSQCYYNFLFEKEVEELMKRLFSNSVWAIIFRKALNMESKLSLLIDYAADIETELNLNIIRQSQSNATTEDQE